MGKTNDKNLSLAIWPKNRPKTAVWALLTNLWMVITRLPYKLHPIWTNDPTKIISSSRWIDWWKYLSSISFRLNFYILPLLATCGHMDHGRRAHPCPFPKLKYKKTINPGHLYIQLVPWTALFGTRTLGTRKFGTCPKCPICPKQNNSFVPIEQLFLIVPNVLDFPFSCYKQETLRRELPLHLPIILNQLTTRVLNFYRN